MFKKGQELLQLEAKVNDLKDAKRHSISQLNAELQRLESDRNAIREEISANLAKHKQWEDKSKSSTSLSSITQLKFLSSSRQISDSMSKINSKRQKIDKYDKMINEAIEKKRNEESRQLALAKLFKEIQSIIDSVAEMDRSDAEKSTTELWCLNTSLKLQNEIKEAQDSIENYSNAMPLLEEARTIIQSIVINSKKEHQNEHLKKVAYNSSEANGLIADTCLSQAWSYLCCADPHHEEVALPPLPENIPDWAVQVQPVIEELLAEIKPSIASKEGIIADHEAQQRLIQEKLSREYRILLISAVKGSQTDLPEYKDIFGTKDTNDSSFNSANFTRNNDLPPSLPPRPKSETVKLVKNPLVSIDPSLLEEFGSDPLHANIRNAQAPPLYSGDPGWTSGQQESSFEPSIDVNLKVDMDEHNSINAPIIHTLENQEIGLDSLRLDENPWN